MAYLLYNKNDTTYSAIFSQVPLRNYPSFTVEKTELKRGKFYPAERNKK